MLAGFTREGVADGALHVLDLKRGMQRKGTPLGEGHKRDHYRVEAADPFAVEKLMANTLEGPAASVVSEIIRTRQLPTDEEKRGVLLSLVASVAARVRGKRAQIEGFYAEVATMLKNLNGTSLEVYQNVMRTYAQEDVSAEDFEQYRDYLAGKDRARFVVDRSTAVLNELQVAAGIFPLLWDRDWCLITSDEAGSEFVCSDAPVVLVDPQQRGFVGPGFGLPTTTVVMPLWRQGLLYGTWGKTTMHQRSATLQNVADFNQLTLCHAHEFVWSPRPRFPFTWRGEQLLRDPARILGELSAQANEESED